jgi:hypothetical protein
MDLLTALSALLLIQLFYSFVEMLSLLSTGLRRQETFDTVHKAATM